MGEWIDSKDWYNDRILETFIGSDQVDAHNERIPLETYESVLPWLNEYGYYNYMHDDGGMPIGQFLGYRFREDPSDGLTKPEMRVGIHDTEHSKNPLHDKIWKQISKKGLDAGSSIHGKKLGKIPHYDKTGQYDELGDITAWAVAWASDDPANPGAWITDINRMAKMSEKGCTMCRECGSMEKGKKYIKSPGEAPEGANVRQGPKGGYYYEESGSSKPSGEQQTPEKPSTHTSSGGKISRDNANKIMYSHKERVTNMKAEDDDGARGYATTEPDVSEIYRTTSTGSSTDGFKALDMLGEKNKETWNALGPLWGKFNEGTISPEEERKRQALMGRSKGFTDVANDILDNSGGMEAYRAYTDKRLSNNNIQKSCSDTSPGAGDTEKQKEGENMENLKKEFEPAPPVEEGGGVNIEEIVAQLAERVDKLYTMLEDMNKAEEPCDATEEAPTVEEGIEKTMDDIDNPGNPTPAGEEKDKDADLIKARREIADLKKSIANKVSKEDLVKEFENLQKNRGLVLEKKKMETKNKIENLFKGKGE